ncbi:zeta toxin family protein [Paenarthrobacter ureafaciens]|uniref:zeta toxin family protein n=1 Tax=Paenarthrobacter ureafaciens TaxID=37931 RepID=UPI00140754EA|nr:zeta toxin family protein [Paenarthrobacter ureafaciens]MCX8454749.1 zeta toxin family protein [Paenarthrobacter ureafaciens]MCY0973555.1 zeta toxin family protein [Paenarthrobacter ureafaciens]
MAADRDTVHAALTELYAPGNDLEKAPPLLLAYFDDAAVVRLARTFMGRQQDVVAGGRAVVIAAGPPGAGKTEALKTLDLRGFRLIDPDDAKDMILDEAERHGLLSYRLNYTLPDGGPVGVREVASHVHVISTRTTNLVRQLALAAGENVILDGTLSWEKLPAQYIDELYLSRYEEVDVVDVETHRASAIERARQRWWTGRLNDPAMGGRFVPDAVIEHCYQTDTSSICAANALKLAQMAAEAVGRGTLRRFDVDQATGEVHASAVTTFE